MQQVPDVKPEPYHGSVSHTARANYHLTASGSRLGQEMIQPASMFGAAYPPVSQSMNRYRSAPYRLMGHDPTSSIPARLTPEAGYAGSSSGNLGSSLPPAAAALPYALVPEPYTPSLFGEF